MQYLGAMPKTTECAACFKGKPFNIIVIQIYAPPLMLKKMKLDGPMKTNKSV